MLRDLEEEAVKHNWAYAKHLSGTTVSCGDNYDYPGVLLVAEHCK